MKIQQEDYNKITNSIPITLAIGNFDGLHLGHQSLLNEVNKFSDTKSAIMTFSPHPQAFFSCNESSFLTLMSTTDKLNFFKIAKITQVFVVAFTKEFASLSMAQFISFLKKINVKRIVVGQDFRFSKNNAGRPSDLAQDFEVKVMPGKYYQDHLISTTIIKTNIEVGNFDTAKAMLNRNYRFKGLVVSGTKIGRTMGFPTANLLTTNYVLPKKGVYAVSVFLGTKKYAGLLSVGTNPTVSENKLVKVEVYLNNFEGNIYGQELEVEVLKFLRDEKKFPSKEELILQMKNDLTFI